MRNKIDIETIRNLVDYDQETGIFISKVSRGNVKAGKEIGRDNGFGYLRFEVLGIQLFCHRVAFCLVHGYEPPVVDHINRIRSDNRICNLRAADVCLNNRNADKKHYGKSGFKGASFHKERGKWRANIRNGGKLIYLGYFESVIEAAFAYDVASLELHGEYGKRNFLPLVI